MFVKSCTFLRRTGPTMIKKCSFDDKKLCVLKIFFSYEKGFNQKTVSYRIWHNKVSPLAHHILCLILQKTRFWSLLFRIPAQFWEQIVNLRSHFNKTEMHSCVQFRKIWKKKNQFGDATCFISVFSSSKIRHSFFRLSLWWSSFQSKHFFLLDDDFS